MHDNIIDLDTTAHIITKTSSSADSFDCSQFEADKSDSDYILLLKRRPDTLSVGQPEDDVKTRDEDSKCVQCFIAYDKNEAMLAVGTRND